MHRPAPSGLTRSPCPAGGAAAAAWRALRWGACALLLPWLLQPTPAAAYCRASTATSANGPCAQEPGAPLLYWDRGCFTYRLHQNVLQRINLLSEDEIRAIFERAFGSWEAVDCGAPPFVAEQDARLASTPWPEFVYDEPNEAIITALTAQEWPQLDPAQPTSAFAITFLWHDTKTGELLDADIALNLGQGPFGDCGNQRCRDGTVDLENTITHEAGHTMGLGHATDPASTMYPDAMPGVIFMRDLTADDEAGLCSVGLPSHECGTDDGDTSCACPTPPVVSSVVVQDGLCACALGARSRPLPSAGLWLLGGVLLWRRERRRRGRAAGRRR